jgi:hypothetical protein
MTLLQWIAWGLQPCDRRHKFHSYVLARQAARDMGAPVAHEEFRAAMKAAGFKVVDQRGSATFYAARDTLSKRQYFRRKFIVADDTAVHPLVEAAQ